MNFADKKVFYFRGIVAEGNFTGIFFRGKKNYQKINPSYNDNNHM